jgi:hypothetical protein
MKIFVAIDDTDNIESRGTGVLAEILSNILVQKGWGTSSAVTRHQMLIHPDIPYTSHNSSMCFTAEIKKDILDKFIMFAQDFIERESESGSDPGLCIAVGSKVRSSDKLIDFGKSAKQRVLKKKDAYDLARLVNVHLSEHGGTGLGIIGSLAGVGLRMTGNDGRFKGHFVIKPAGTHISVKEIKKYTHVDIVQSLDGKILKDDEMVTLGEKVKAVLLRNMSTMLVYNNGNGNSAAKWSTCTKQMLRPY